MKKLDFYKALKIIEETLKNGGYSFNEYNSGYMVSLEGSERKISLYVNDRYDIAYKITEFFEEFDTVNTWLDDGTIYLDVSVNIQDKEEALKFAKKNNQLAIYDCKENKAIEL